MTLNEKIIARIKQEGAISLADYMHTALCDEAGGYYTNNQPLGAGGDFTTAPEISQLFGEMLAVWCVDLWQRMGAPAPFCLLELGAGRGTLMADILRTAQDTAPEFIAAAKINFVEISPPLQQLQAAAVPQAVWHKDLSALPAQPTLFIANEFFDALPIQQFIFERGEWFEIKIDAQDDKLIFAKINCEQTKEQASEGDILETSPASIAAAKTLAQHITTHSGAGLIIDYGYAAPAFGDSLQAVQKHQPISMAAALQKSGEVDLTAHVNFHALASAAKQAGATTYITNQGLFLQNLGIAARTQNLSAATPDKRETIEGEYHRLTDLKQMGELFKVLAFAAPDAPPLAGF